MSEDIQSIERKVAERMASMDVEKALAHARATDNDGTIVPLGKRYSDIMSVILEPLVGQGEACLFVDWDDSEGTDSLRVWAMDHNGQRVSRYMHCTVRGEAA